MVGWRRRRPVMMRRRRWRRGMGMMVRRRGWGPLVCPGFLLSILTTSKSIFENLKKLLRIVWRSPTSVLIDGFVYSCPKELLSERSLLGAQFFC
jgi:hypothetical protein